MSHENLPQFKNLFKYDVILMKNIFEVLQNPWQIKNPDQPPSYAKLHPLFDETFFN
jgi:hypothetical protein